MGTAGALNLIVPFEGVSLSARKALIIAGLGSIPRLIGAILSTIYAILFSVNTGSGTGAFSAGINLIPFMPQSEWIGFLSHIGIFDVWGAWIVLSGTWVFCQMKEKRWNTVTILIAIVCLIFGAFSTY